MSASINPVKEACRWCGALHAGEACSLVKAIEYDGFGSPKRVEFWPPKVMEAPQNGR